MRHRPRSKASHLGYDAVEQRRGRRARFAPLTSEDRALPGSGRNRLVSIAREINRNFTLAGWIVRKHLDYVSQFEFHSREEDEGFNTDLESFMKWWARPANCDVSRRFGLSKLVRMAEARRTLDGDIGLIKTDTGQIQLIESDRIRNPDRTQFYQASNQSRWESGVKIDEVGGPLAYSIHRRGQSGAGFEFEREVPAGNMILHGYFERYDQVRGISPLACALNGLTDIYENFDYALARAKLEQLFAMVITRAQSTDDGNDDEEETDYDNYIKLMQGPQVLQMDPGDMAQFLQSNQPSNQFQDFTRYMLMVVCKALDIPYSFFDESHTNFFGSRGAWLHYERSTSDRREDVADMYRRLTIWRIGLAIINGDIRLPRGKTLATLNFEWVPRGMPWWDPVKEIAGEVASVAAGFDTPQNICKSRGRGDYLDNLKQIAKARDLCVSLGITPSWLAPPSITINEAPGGQAA